MLLVEWDREPDKQQQQLGSTRSPVAGLKLLMRRSTSSHFAELDSAAATAAAAFTGLWNAAQKKTLYKLSQEQIVLGIG